jgi:hypothetical protein
MDMQRVHLLQPCLRWMTTERGLTKRNRDHLPEFLIPRQLTFARFPAVSRHILASISQPPNCTHDYPVTMNYLCAT